MTTLIYDALEATNPQELEKFTGNTTNLCRIRIAHIFTIEDVTNPI